MKYHLLIDDYRDWQLALYEAHHRGTDDMLEMVDDDIYVWAKTYEEGATKLQERNWDSLYLDHDLGCKKNGYDIICLLEELVREGKCQAPEIFYCISANPVGRERIYQAWEAIQEHLKRV